jgi:hypothetical protein
MLQGASAFSSEHKVLYLCNICSFSCFFNLMGINGVEYLYFFLTEFHIVAYRPVAR